MADEILAELPLFPLQTVLFPGARLPLRIFEPRYLDMIGRAYRDHTPFGVVGLRQGGEVQRPDAGPAGFAAETFGDVGTLARITHLERPQPGLLVIRSEGTRRFRLRQRERRKTGLWVGLAELLPEDAAMAVPEDLAAARETLRGVLLHLERQIDDPGQRPLGEPHRLDDCAWLANSWCTLLPLRPDLKQRLLETDSPLLRLELVADLLEALPSAS
jgi:uncharacterized protein